MKGGHYSELSDNFRCTNNSARILDSKGFGISTEGDAHMSRRKTDDAVIERLHNEGLTTTKIAEHFGVSSRAIRLRYEIIGINVSERRRTPIYAVNEQFFDTWSPDMAYTLGFILTDGCVSGNTVSISQAVPEPLEAIKRMMSSEHPINKVPNGVNPLYTLNISRKSLVTSIAKRGIYAAKSLTVELPEVPDEYFADFLRGVIDGDGWAHPKGYKVTITSGSESFAEQLNERLNDVGFPFRVEHDGYAYRIKLSGKDEIKRLESYLYYDPNAFYIERKREAMRYHKRSHKLTA